MMLAHAHAEIERSAAAAAAATANDDGLLNDAVVRTRGNTVADCRFNDGRKREEFVER